MRTAQQVLQSLNISKEDLLKDIDGVCERLVKAGMEEGIKASAEEAGKDAELLMGHDSSERILKLINQIITV